MDSSQIEYKILLGSASPRRHELLNAMGIEHTVIPIDADEVIPEGMAPERIVEYLAEFKSQAYSKELAPNELLITADTIVVLGNDILGKPKDAEDANRMLSALSGKEHAVITGCCLRNSERSVVFHDRTTVHFRSLTSDMIDHYIEQFKPFDKAGAYGIQEWIGLVGIEKIEGSYFNVVGLPTQKLYEALFSF